MEQKKTAVILIGAGIMSATIGLLLKELNPDITITVLEKLDRIGEESSNAWNNAGTGHSSFCELNYTPELENGQVDVTKALKIAASFESSKELWAYFVKEKNILSPSSFINRVPHISYVWGDDDVRFLKKRYDALIKYPLFENMQYTRDNELMNSWMPLVMKGRPANTPMAATKMDIGTDIDFGALTNAMINHLATLDDVSVHLDHEVRDLEKQENGLWRVSVEDLKQETGHLLLADFVFIGSGGGTLPLLQKSNIDEAEGYGGFPVSGQWLKCNNKQVIELHHAKVYGKAAVGSPPMSVPHLDTRIINGEKELLFGPYAGFSTKFLKYGSYWDLPASIEFENVIPMLSAGYHNMPLTGYLIEQAMQSPEDRFEALKAYLPTANPDDWELVIAGQRVQVIKKDRDYGGVLEFGTEIVSAADGSLAALLGASPGASTSVKVMLDVLRICFPDQMQTDSWINKLKQMIPSYGKSFIDDRQLCLDTRAATGKILFQNK